MIYNTGDIKNDVLVQLNQSTTTAFYSDTILGNWISKAHSWAAGYAKWPFTEGKLSTTFVTTNTDELGNYIMEYPEGWKADSIRLLQIGGKRYDKKNIYEFQKFKEDNPQDNRKIYSDYSRRLYINNASGPSGSLTVWGQYLPAQLDNSDPTQLTVFSGYEDEGNEAIIQEVLSYARVREKTPTAMVKGKFVSASIAHHQAAMDILERLLKRINDEQFGYQSTDGEGMFKRTDILGGALRDDLFKRDQFY